MTSAAAPDEQAWDACFAQFERCLAAQRAALAAGRPEDVHPFVPPQLGPLPASLRDRAQRLQAEASELEAQLAAAAAHVGRELRLVTTMGRSSQDDGQRAGYFDGRG